MPGVSDQMANEIGSCFQSGPSSEKERSVAAVGEHEVVEDADAEELRARLEPRGRCAFFGRGPWIFRRVMVEERDRGALARQTVTDGRLPVWEYVEVHPPASPVKQGGAEFLVLKRVGAERVVAAGVL